MGCFLKKIMMMVYCFSDYRVKIFGWVVDSFMLDMFLYHPYILGVLRMENVPDIVFQC